MNQISKRFVRIDLVIFISIIFIHIQFNQGFNNYINDMLYIHTTTTIDSVWMIMVVKLHILFMIFTRFIIELAIAIIPIKIYSRYL